MGLSLALELQRRRDLARTARQAAENALVPLTARAQAIAALGPPEAPLPALPDTLVAVLAVLREGEVRQGVRMDALALPGRANGSEDGLPDAVAIGRLARPLSGAPGLRGLRMDVRATYRSYAGLQHWLAALGNLPLSLRRVWLDERQVQLALELVGR